MLKEHYVFLEKKFNIRIVISVLVCHMPVTCLGWQSWPGVVGVLFYLFVRVLRPF